MAPRKRSQREGQQSASKEVQQKSADGGLSRLPEKQKQEVLKAEILKDPRVLNDPKVAAVFMKHHSGPLPAPEDFREYEDVLPGASARIVAMAEKSLDAAISKSIREDDRAENRQDKEFRESGRGQIFAFILALIALFGGLFLAYKGMQITGTLFGGAGLAAIIYTFIHGKQHD